MFENLLTGHETSILIKLGLCLLIGFLIGVERENRGKSAGISTQSFILAGAMMFTYLSTIIEPGSQGRIAANIVTGIGFLGAGIILKSDSGKITNLTTAASIWFSASIGMAIGFSWYIIAFIGTAYCLIVPRIPHLKIKWLQRK